MGRARPLSYLNAKFSTAFRLCASQPSFSSTGAFQNRGQRLVMSTFDSELSNVKVEIEFIPMSIKASTISSVKIDFRKSLSDFKQSIASFKDPGSSCIPRALLLSGESL